MTRHHRVGRLLLVWSPRDPELPARPLGEARRRYARLGALSARWGKRKPPQLCVRTVGADGSRYDVWTTGW